MPGIPKESCGDITFLCDKSVKYPIAFALNISGWIKGTVTLYCRIFSYMKNVMLLQIYLEHVFDTH